MESQSSRGGIRRIVAASLIGTTIEWYDNSSDRGYDLPYPRICAIEVSTEPARGNGAPARYRRSGSRRTPPARLAHRDRLQSVAYPIIQGLQVQAS
ncbi:hypothetical protein [Streptomyces sp. NBC_00273]|uniref:hypothetical protein n=1 Tax=Streptomyces sp. NBC_00273 TaxID=2903644 RepID=UPI002E29AED5|nr:hypothetical protein [Streptomyces sp. NBC_00273]